MESTRELRIDKLCRTCLSESPKMLSLADPMGNTTLKIFEALSFVANISVNPSDNFPNQICIECGPILLQSESFKRRCIESETKLQRMVQDQNNAAESSVKTEFSTENCNFPCIEPYQCAICLLKFSNVHDLHLHALKLHKLEVKNQIDAEKESAEDSKVQVEILNNGNECVKQELFDGNEFDADNSYPDDFDAEFGADTQELLNALEIPINVKKKRKSYFCKSCNMNFNTSHLYHDHKRRLHKKNRSIKKEKISSTAKRKSVSSDDEKPLKMIKIEQEAYFCEMCGINFKTSKSFKNHVRRRHEPTIMSHTALETKLTSNNKHIRPKRELQCSICSRRFAKKGTLALHIQRHTSSEEKRHVCSLCKREFLHRAHLDNHILSIHTTDNGLKCQYCMIGFPTQDSLDLHILSHNIPKKHQCPHCAKAFNMLSTLKDHLRTHTGEKPFLCPTCGKGFSQNTNLIEHLRRHQGIKPFKCEICDQRFVSKGELAAHNRKHSGAHPFVCADCGSGFTTSSSLVKHRRTHTGERPYACDLCSMTFAASGTLKNHRRTHTGEKPYKCSHCDKAFVQKNDLVSHTRCHTGERPYVCPACGQAFRQSSALKTHLKMHQHKEPQMKEPLLHQVRKELMLPGLMLTPVTNIDGLN